MLADRGVPVSGSVAYGITMQVLDGLAHAHEKGWVHRDVRLSSVLMAERGGDRVARLSDLGLAELFQAPPTSAATPALPLSLWAFVPPERLTHAREEGPPGDVFSAAALFYYLLTGVPPRDTDRGQDPRQSLLENEAVPLNRRDPTLAKSVASVVDRALRSDPQERYEDAGAFRRALERAV